MIEQEEQNKYKEERNISQASNKKRILEKYIRMDEELNYHNLGFLFKFQTSN